MRLTLQLPKLQSGERIGTFQFISAIAVTGSSHSMALAKELSSHQPLIAYTVKSQQTDSQLPLIKSELSRLGNFELTKVLFNSFR